MILNLISLQNGILFKTMKAISTTKSNLEVFFSVLKAYEKVIKPLRANFEHLFLTNFKLFVYSFTFEGYMKENNVVFESNFSRFYFF